MAVNLSFIGGAGWQFLTDNGKPLDGGKIYTYAAGTDTPLATYTDRTGGTANANPIILDSAGRTPSQIWSTEGLLYKYVVKSSLDVQQRSWDNIGGSVVASDLAQDLAASSGSSLVGFLQAGTGAVATTTQAKLLESVNVADFGAVGDGSTDDTTAIQAAMDAHSNVEFGPGTFKITAPLEFNSYQELTGESKGGIAGKTKIVAYGAIKAFVSKTRGLSACFHPVFRNLTVNNSVAALAGGGAGSGGIDLFDTSFAVLENCSFRYHEKNVLFGGTLAGYYNTLKDCEISSATYGLFFDTSGNSNRVVGGRVHSCTTGIYGLACNDQFVTCAVESCETGIDLGSGCSGWMIHTRFEGNGKTLVGDVAITTLAGAAILRDGSVNNHVFGFCSSAADRIIDLGENFIHTKSTGYSGAAPYGRENMFFNESLNFDASGDGIADGLALSAALPAGTTMSLTTTAGGFVTGTNSQLFHIDTGTGTSRRDLQVGVFTTTVGVRYVFSARVKTNYTSAWNLRSGISFATTTYANLPLNLQDEWAEVSIQFVATTTTSYVYFYTAAFAVVAGLAYDPKLWVDSIYFGIGDKSPEYGDTAKRIAVLPSGDVGIGTTAPTEQLQIVNTGATATQEITSGTPSATSGTSQLVLRAYNSGSSATYPMAVVAGESTGAGDTDLTLSTTTDNTGPQERLRITHVGVVTPGADNTQTLGSAALRWSTVYAGTGAINTSDVREKQQVRELSEAERAVAIRCKSLVRAFKFNDAVITKGDGARIHFGVMAQDVADAFAAENLDAFDYSMFCYDAWEETLEVVDSEGGIRHPYRAAGNRYGVRYEELLCFITSAL